MGGREGEGMDERGGLTTCFSVGLRWNSQRKGSLERFPLSVRVIPPSGEGEEEREEEVGGEWRWEERLARRTGRGASKSGFKDCVCVCVCVCVRNCVHHSTL